MGASASDQIEAALARTSRNYDQLPYESRPFAQSQPSRIGAIARAFGLEAGPLATARVLELGCASGGNIIPHAQRYPDAHFVGVDLSPVQIAAGQARIGRLGLSNIELCCQSLTDIGDELGSFDYILCHGVYSWVPETVRRAVFRVIARHLSPVGVACVSYNVLPGWRMLQPIHDALGIEVPDDGDLPARVARARELLAFLATTRESGPYGDSVRARAAAMVSLPDDYLAHEFLEEMSHPTTMRAFMVEAARNGLGFLAECELRFSVLENYGADIVRQVRARALGDPVETEQHLDLLTGRTFRQTILVASERLAARRNEIAPESISPLHFLAEAGLRIGSNGIRDLVTDTTGRALPIDSPIIAKGIAALIASYPSSCSFDACLVALAVDDKEAWRTRLIEMLHRMVLAGMVVLSTEPVHAGRGDDEKPRATALARADARDGARSTTNARHEPVVILEAARALLSVMDGTRDRTALAHALEDEVLAGRLVVTHDGSPVTAHDAIREVMAERVAALLPGLANAGLIEVDPTRPDPTA